MTKLLQNYELFFGYKEVFILTSLEILFPEFLLFLSILSLLFLKPESQQKSYYNYWFLELWKFSLINLVIYFFLKLFQLQKYININVFFFNSYWLEDNFIIITKLILSFCIFLTFSFIFFYFLAAKPSKIKVRIIFFFFFTLIFLFSLLMSFDLFGIYLSIEGLTLVLTILIAANLTRISIESGLKYILLSAFSSCFLLLSIGFFLFFFGTTNLLALKILINPYLLNSIINFFFFSFNLAFIKNINYLLIFFFLNLLFKLAAWPCCFWVPNIYLGLSMPVIFYFSTTIKFIFFLFFIRFIFFTFFSYFFFLKTLFLIIALGTTLFGVLGSLFQNKLKLFIAYSGISHIGLVFFSLSVFNFMGVFSALFYLIFYILSSILFFGFILNINIINYHKAWGIKKIPVLYLSDFKGIFLKQKFLACILISIFFFLSGVPPFISFFGKFWIYLILFLDKQYYILIFLFLLSMISTFYYLWWIRSFIFDIDKINLNQFYNIEFSYKLADYYINKFILENYLHNICKLLKFIFLILMLFLFIYSPIFLLFNIQLVVIFSKKLFLVLNIF